jgi:hypothetical protein
MTQNLVVHMQADKGDVHSRRRSDRAYPLNEQGMPKLDLRAITAHEPKCIAIYRIIEWLDVQNSRRYKPHDDKTYCNIYAYDFAYCLGLFIPRVWWSEAEILKIRQNLDERIEYERNVFELNCNSLYRWFEVYGTDMGWQRVETIQSLQYLVNEGTIGIIVARNVDNGRPGHIAVVVPEYSNFIAERNGPEVISPLQSQAGLDKCRLFTNYNWWLSDQFQGLVFG